MTAPLSDEQLTEIRARHDRSRHSGEWRTIEQGDAVADRRLLLAEVDRLRAVAQPYEAAIAAVAVQAAEWAALAPADDWGSAPHDAVLSDVGRLLQRLMAQPAAAVPPEGGQHA